VTKTIRFSMTLTAALLLAGSCTLAQAADKAAGAATYNARCKSCHGADGSGNPAIAKMMNVALVSLGSAEVQKKSDADLKAVVTAGKGKMRPVAGVAGTDLDNVIAFVRSLKK
jgi:cytochrome c6